MKNQILHIDGIVTKLEHSSIHEGLSGKCEGSEFFATIDISPSAGICRIRQSAADPYESNGLEFRIKADIKPGTKIACVIYEV